MQIKSTIVVALMASCFLAACGNYDYQKTSDGLMYKIISSGKGDTLKPGQYLKVYMSATLNDSVLNSNYGLIPAYGPYDTAVKNTYSFIDVLGKMKVGDSCIYMQSVDTLQKKGMLQYNEIFKPGGTIVGTVKILKAFPDESDVNKDYMEEMEQEKKREIARLEDYLKEKKVTAEKTKNGVFVQIENQGTGAAADSGKKVTVNYTGYLKNGKKFDSNVDTAFKHAEPMSFVVGTASVIPGWDEGFPYFKEGAKGKLYIPAMLAYGQQSRGPELPAFSDLIFDVEVLKVEDAPASSPEPGAFPGH